MVQKFKESVGEFFYSTKKKFKLKTVYRLEAEWFYLDDRISFPLLLVAVKLILALSSSPFLLSSSFHLLLGFSCAPLPIVAFATSIVTENRS